MASKYLLVTCAFGREIMFPLKDFPQGLPLSEKQICRCSEKRIWHRPECDFKQADKKRQEAVDAIHDRLADEVLGK